MVIRTNDPRLYVPPAGELTRQARQGLVAEWDMVTFDASNPLLLTDTSGNGRNALFNATPTKTALGVSFNGTYYADATLPLLGSSYTAVVVYTGVTNGYCIFGNRNDSDNNGTMFKGGTSGITHGVGANQVSVVQATGTGVYQAPILKVQEDNQGRAKQVGAGILGYRNTFRADVLDPQTVWRIGGMRATVGGNPNGLGANPMNSGTIAYAAVWGWITGERQDAAIASYLRAKLALRGVTILPN